jgi:hypothetical protein
LSELKNSHRVRGADLFEVHSLDHPRRHQAKSELKEVCVTHAAPIG